MEEDKKLFDDLYKNVRMGSYAIDCIYNAIESKELKKLVDKQNKVYLDYTNRLESIAHELDIKISDINPFLKASSFTSIKMNTMMNTETNHLCAMLIEGTTMGIITTITAISEYPESDIRLIDIAHELRKSEELFTESLKNIILINKTIK